MQTHVHGGIDRDPRVEPAGVLRLAFQREWEHGQVRDRLNGVKWQWRSQYFSPEQAKEWFLQSRGDVVMRWQDWSFCDDGDDRPKQYW